MPPSNLPNGVNLNGKAHDHDHGQAEAPGPCQTALPPPPAIAAPIPPSFEPTLADLANPHLAARLEPFRTAYLTTPPELRVDVVPGVAVVLTPKPAGPYQLTVIDITGRQPVMYTLGMSTAAARKLRGALDLVL